MNNPRYCMTIVNNYTTYIFVYVTVLVAYVFIPLFNLPVNVVTTDSLLCLNFPSVQTAPVHGRAYWCVEASLFFCVDPMTRLRPPPGTNTVSNSSPTQYPPQGTVTSTSIQCTQLFCLNGFVSSISQISSWIVCLCAMSMVCCLSSPVNDKHTSNSIMQSTKQFIFQCGCWRLDYMLSEREHTCLGDGTPSLCTQAITLQTGNWELSLCSQSGRHFQLLRLKKNLCSDHSIFYDACLHDCYIYVVSVDHDKYSYKKPAILTTLDKIFSKRLRTFSGQYVAYFI